MKTSDNLFISGLEKIGYQKYAFNKLISEITTLLGAIARQFLEHQLPTDYIKTLFENVLPCYYFSCSNT